MKHTWIHGDCLAEMEGMEVNLVIADPPYGQFPLINLAIESARNACSGPSFFFMYAEDLFRIGAEPDQVLHWVKTASTKNTVRRYSRFVEAICAYDLDKSSFNQDTHWSTRSGTFIDQLTFRSHPFQKPESLIEKLVAVNSSEGDFVLDPFAGTGTVRKVCERMGRNSVSIEIDGALCQ